MPINDIREFVDLISSKYENRVLFCVSRDNVTREISYLQFKENVEKWIRFFANSEIYSKNIALSGPLTTEWIYAFFGVICSGNTAVIIDLYDDPSYLTRNALPTIDVVLAPDNRLHLSGQIGIILNTNELPNGSACNHRIKPNDIAVIIPTSGTSGKKKYVCLSHVNLIADMMHSVEIFKDLFNEYDRLYSFLPQYHMYEVMVALFVTPYYGATVLIDESTNKNYIKFLQLYKPSVILVVPSVAKALLNLQRDSACKHTLDTIKTIICGGASLDYNTVLGFEKIGIKVFSGYGATECSPVISCNTAYACKRNSVGKIEPSKYCDIIIDNGEIVVKGSIVSSRYIKEDGRVIYTDSVFRTGDLGTLDDDGFLYIHGRSKNIIVLDNGINISPESIETKLYECDSIKDVIVFESRDDNNVFLTAQITPIPTDDLDSIKKAIRTFIDDFNLTMPYYSRIHDVKFVSDNIVSKNRMSKIIR